MQLLSSEFTCFFFKSRRFKLYGDDPCRDVKHNSRYRARVQGIMHNRRRMTKGKVGIALERVIIFERTILGRLKIASFGVGYSHEVELAVISLS